ncbi:MAG TPA: hypothetical protein VL625_09615 [Patescibacteria group bacterium]|jgi:Ca2+-binding EF-hand superfamily protein|nr:hypothetical protein [Patescibacteria group bacterium]
MIGFRKRIFLISTFVILNLSSFAIAQENDKYPSVNDIPAALNFELSAFRPQSSEKYIEQIFKRLKIKGCEKFPITQADMSMLSQKIKLMHQQENVARIMAFDRNFDGKVSQTEIHDSLIDHRGGADDAELGRIEERMMKFDANHDGVITEEEMSAWNSGDPQSSALNSCEAFFLLDPNKDGQLTADELRSLTLKAFRTVDVNGDDVISDQEREPLLAASRRIK